jgi:hypothetical protein
MVVFNEPITEFITGPEPAIRGENWDHAAITELVHKMKAVGLGDGAIVVRRDKNLFEMRSAPNWGIVRDMRTYRQTPNTVYFPLLIAWFKDGTVSNLWPDEICVVHHAIDWQDMNKHLTEQMGITYG